MGTGDRQGTSVAADWYPDPARTGRLRYWDGTAWTAWVSTSGDTTLDTETPPAGPPPAPAAPRSAPRRPPAPPATARLPRVQRRRRHPGMWAPPSSLRAPCGRTGLGAETVTRRPDTLRDAGPGWACDRRARWTAARGLGRADRREPDASRHRHHIDQVRHRVRDLGLHHPGDPDRGGGGRAARLGLGTARRPLPLGRGRGHLGTPDHRHPGVGRLRQRPGHLPRRRRLVAHASRRSWPSPGSR